MSPSQLGPGQFTPSLASPSSEYVDVIPGASGSMMTWSKPLPPMKVSAPVLLTSAKAVSWSLPLPPVREFDPGPPASLVLPLYGADSPLPMPFALIVSFPALPSTMMSNGSTGKLTSTSGVADSAPALRLI